jgi:hypothetical protein
MLYRGYLLNSEKGTEKYVTTLVANDEREAIASIAAWIGDHKVAPPGSHQIRVYSDEAHGFTQTTIDIS